MKLSRSLYVLVIAAGLLLTACNQLRPEDRLCKRTSFSESGSDQADFAFGYFPPAFAEETLDCGFGGGPQPIIGEVEREWFPRQWQAACEPSLYAMARSAQPADFTLRFSYIPSFDPSVFITVQRKDEELVLIAKQLNGAGGYEPGTLARSKEIVLTDQQAVELETMLAEGGLFQETAKACELGFDGSRWIFELVSTGEYRMVNRWSPSDGAAHDLGELLIRLSGWSIETY